MLLDQTFSKLVAPLVRNGCKYLAATHCIHLADIAGYRDPVMSLEEAEALFRSEFGEPV